VRCSSFERALDEYVEGDVPPREREQIEEHLAGCASCRMLVEELRVVDALLARPRTLEPAADFTRATMSEVLATAPPAAPQSQFWPITLAYLVFAWAVLAVWFTVNGPIAHLTEEVLASLWFAAASWFTAISSIVGHTFGGAGAAIALLGVAVLCLDALLAIALVAMLKVVRPRLAAKLSSGERR
jgi:anti-sigma factor RsiW